MSTTTRASEELPRFDADAAARRRADVVAADRRRRALFGRARLAAFLLCVAASVGGRVVDSPAARTLVRGTDVAAIVLAATAAPVFRGFWRPRTRLDV